MEPNKIKDEFNKQVIKAFPKSNIRIRDDSIIIDVDDSSTHPRSLSIAYRPILNECAGLPDDEVMKGVESYAKHLKEYDSSLQPGTNTPPEVERWEYARDKIEWCLQRADQFKNEIHIEKIYEKPFFNNLVWRLATNHGSLYASVLTDTTKKWMQTEDIIAEKARENMKVREEDIMRDLIGGSETVALTYYELSDPIANIAMFPKKLRNKLDENAGFKNKPALILFPNKDMIIAKVYHGHASEFLLFMSMATDVETSVEGLEPLTNIPILLDEDGTLSEFKHDDMPSGYMASITIDVKNKKIGMSDIARIGPKEPKD